MPSQVVPAVGGDTLWASALESDALLEFLFRHLKLDEFTVRLRWWPKMMAIWDNRSVQHRPVNNYFPAQRRQHRVTIASV